MQLATSPRSIVVASRSADKHRDVAGVRHARPTELAAIHPIRIELATAARNATVRELVEKQCIDPVAALELDHPDRVVAHGERFKCTDRKRPD